MAEVFSIARESIARSRRVRRHATILRAESLAEQRRHIRLVDQIKHLIEQIKRLPPADRVN